MLYAFPLLFLLLVLPSRVAFYRALFDRIACLLCYLLLTLGLSPVLLLSFAQVVWARENATALSSHDFHRLWSNDKCLPATLTPWKEVDLVYKRLFPYDHARQPHPPSGCVVLPAISHHIDKQGTGITTLSVVLMLRCWERIDLLRPARWVRSRLHQQNRQGYLWLSIPEMGIMNVQVHMVAVKSSLFNPATLNVKSASSRPVIGLFIRHTMNVKQYTFKDTITRKLDRIKATPNHPFYVLNRHRYIPASHLSTHDRLINVLGHSVTLVCPKGKTNHCGKPYHPGQVITVYNLEVYGQHRYFVGEPGVMVHNGYTCEDCKLTFPSQEYLDFHQRGVHNREQPYKCAQCNREFIYQGRFRKHVNKEHGITSNREKTFQCDICDKNFSSKVNLKSHLSTKGHIQAQIIQQMRIKKAAALRELDTPGTPTDASSLASGSSERVEQQRARSRSPINPLGIDAPPSLFPELDSTLPALSSGESSLSWLENDDF